jgi:ABC-type nitrate/sulfonate/bicarbonate transport system permease component
MTDNRQNLRSAVRAAITLTLAAAAYEALARSGYFAPALLPTLDNVARALFASLDV